MRVLSSKTIGEATFDLSELQLGVGAEKIAQLEGGGRMVAVLNLRKNPRIGTQLSGHEMHIRLPTLRIVLERNVYMAGDVVKGVIRYFERHKTSISGIRLCFEGISYSQFVDTSDSDNTVTHISTYPLLQHTSILIGDHPKTGKRMEIGPCFLFERAFEFRLPVDLLPSIETSKGCYNRYQVIAYVDRQSMPPKVTKTRFFVNVPPAAAPPGNTSTTMLTLATDGAVSITATAPATLWAGKNFDVHLLIDNSGGNKSLDTLEMKLICEKTEYTVKGLLHTHEKLLWARTCSTAPSVHNTEPMENLFNLKNFLPVPAGKSHEATVTVQVPDAIPPTLIATSSPLIQSRFVFYAEAKALRAGDKSIKATVFLAAVGMTEFKLPRIKGLAPSLQCLSYTPPAPYSVSHLLVPLDSTDGKLVDPGLSIAWGQFDFKPLGTPTSPPYYLQHDIDFMHDNINQLTPDLWEPGTIPSWLPKPPAPAPLPDAARAYTASKVKPDAPHALDESSS